ncbi:MAG: TRAP transporter substrate-binding protein [Pseudomonadota bacterium]
MGFSKTLAAAAAFTAASFGFGSIGEVDAKERWKLQAAFSQAAPIIGEPPHRVAKAINAFSGGDLKVKVFEPGAIVGGTKYFDAVSSGALDAAYGTSGYNVGKNSAYAFFSSVPFGPGIGEFLAWMNYGGGKELAQELYARDNIHFVLCGIHAPETSGWFRKEINSPEDLKGLKMRFFGLGAKVMEKLGVSTQLLAGGDIYPALELGTIDAAEFSMPVIDFSKGFYQVAKHNYFPGWHQQATTNELLVNMDSWNKLSDEQKLMVETACAANITTMISESEAVQFSAMQENVERGAVIHRWSDEMLDTFEGAWNEVIDEEVAGNEDSKKIWASFSEFRKNYAIWGDNGYLD